MIRRSNLHTHTTYCDGRDTMRTMVSRALSLGFESLGFSSHCHTGLPFDVCGIEKSDIDRYFSEIDTLQAECSDRLRLYRGFEIEGLVPFIDPRLDYSIGSIHIFRTSAGLLSIDDTPEIFQAAVDAFSGDVMRLLETYFEDLVAFARTSSYDITGHFDLPTKLNAHNRFFSESDPRYIDMATSAIDSICAAGKIIELNTGAISRGYRTSPYPAPFILRRILRNHAPVIITSDCHTAASLDCWFPQAVALLTSLGFTEQARLTPTGFQLIPLT